MIGGSRGRAAAVPAQQPASPSAPPSLLLHGSTHLEVLSILIPGAPHLACTHSIGFNVDARCLHAMCGMCKECEAANDTWQQNSWQQPSNSPPTSAPHVCNGKGEASVNQAEAGGAEVRVIGSLVAAGLRGQGGQCRGDDGSSRSRGNCGTACTPTTTCTT